jgi:hypothetical protein
MKFGGTTVQITALSLPAGFSTSRSISTVSRSTSPDQEAYGQCVLRDFRESACRRIRRGAGPPLLRIEGLEVVWGYATLVCNERRKNGRAEPVRSLNRKAPQTAIQTASRMSAIQESC